MQTELEYKFIETKGMGKGRQNERQRETETESCFLRENDRKEGMGIEGE